MCEVSIVIPSYNRSSQIKRCIDNILRQTFIDYEIIVVDDGSTDDTEEVVKKFSDKRVIYIKSIENRGACSARNIGIKNAKGKYIAFQDSDDTWKDNKIERQLDFMKELDVDMVTCKLKRQRKVRNRIFPNDNLCFIELEHILFKNYGSTQTFFVKRSCFEDTAIRFDESMSRYQDWDFLINFIVNGYKVACLNEELVYQNVGRNTISSSHIKGVESLELILRKYCNFYVDKPNLTAYIHYLLGTHLLGQGIYSNEFKKAFELGYKDIKCVLKGLLCEYRG